ncbi:MAG: adenosine kinase [Bacteroidales bacterium]|jgi:sugar/nucleoside kinase (ribokinase family)|nr:adenosine kinase [Bacteroidales bacterium]
MKVLGIGNALTDIIIRLDSDEHLNYLGLPKGSMQLIGEKRSREILDYFSQTDITIGASGSRPFTYSTGGSASNAVTGCASLELECGFIGSIGDDEYGKFYVNDLIERGMKPYFQTLKTAPSGTAITLISPDSERTFATHLGAAYQLTSSFLKKEYFEGYNYFHVEGYLVQNYELLETAMKMAREAGAKVSFDMGSYNIVEENIDYLRRIIPQYVDILFCNEQEAQTFTGKRGTEALVEAGKTCALVAMKTGSRGSMLIDKNTVYIIPPFPAERIDTNGAGDSYVSGFLFGLSRGYSLQRTGEIASLISSKVISIVGPKLNEEGWKMVKDQLRIT